MGLLDRLAAAAGYEPRRDPSDERWWSAVGGTSESGVHVTRERVMQLDIVQAIHEAIAGPGSSIPLMVYRRTGDDRYPARDHPLFHILHRRPNREQSAQEFRDQMIRDLVFERNFYAFIVSEGDTPVAALERIAPERVVKVERDGQGRRWYTVRPLGAGAHETWREDYIWHLRRGPLTESGLAGQPIWQTARETFGRAIAVEDYGARFFRNDGQAGGILEHPGRFTSAEDKQNFLDTWRAAGTGVNQHRDRLLTHGVKYNRHAVQNDQAQFLETIRQAEIKCCGLYNMPPHRVSRLDKATNNNIEHQSIEFVMHCLGPIITGIEQGAARDLLTGSGAGDYFVEHNVAGLLRGDIVARYNAYAKGRQWGWLSVNMIMAMENINGIGPAGDVFLQPMNMIDAAGAVENTQDEQP